MGELSWFARMGSIVGSTMDRLGCVAQWTLFSVLNKWVRGPENYCYYKASFAPNPMLALDSDEALESHETWFAESPAAASVVLGTSQ